MVNLFLILGDVNFGYFYRQNKLRPPQKLSSSKCGKASYYPFFGSKFWCFCFGIQYQNKIENGLGSQLFYFYFLKNIFTCFYFQNMENYSYWDPKQHINPMFNHNH